MKDQKGDRKVKPKKLKLNPLVEKYARGSVSINVHKIKQKNLRKTLEENNIRNLDAAEHNASTEVLLPATEGFIELDNKREKVYHLKQKDIIQNVDVNTAKNAFDLQLTNFGPYCINYSRNGR